MRKKRIQSSTRKTSSSTCLRFIGVSLSGGKSDRACVAVVDYFPDFQGPGKGKLFLSQLIEKITAEEHISADLKIHEIIAHYQDQAKSIAFDVPLSLPKCMTCKLKCPGYESCNEKEIKYIRALYQKDMEKKKPKKMYTPYTQRCVDAYLASTEPEIDVQHALGANLAPITTRGMFIARRLQLKTLEVNSRLSVWRLGQTLKVNKTHLKVFKNSVGGDEARVAILHAMSEKWNLFFYQQDLKTLNENYYAFDAFICAYVGYLEYQGETESRPSGFPRNESFIEIPMRWN